MKMLENLDFVQRGVEPPSQLSQVAGTGLILVAVGFGGLVEAYWALNAGGSIITISAGGGIFISSVMLYRATRDEGDNNG